ncbi:MAG: hypothetical protein JXQ96_08405 [Cyclobacteriaceae bacterium]
MSSITEPARNTITNLQIDALKISPSDRLKSMEKPNKVIPFHTLQKKNKHSVASYFSKTIKDCLDSEMRDLIEPYATVRLTSLIRNAFSASDQVSLNDGSSELENFNFNTSNPFKKTINSKVYIRGGSHNGYAILHVPAFVPANELNMPEEATNFKICARLISISDFELSNELKAYVPADIDSHGQLGSFETTMLPILRMQTQPITTQVCINKGKALEGNVHTLLIAAVKFYCYSNGKFTHLSDHGSMKVMKVL